MSTPRPAATSRRGWILPGAGVLLALGTVLGAFGAHALQSVLTPDRLDVYDTAVRHHFFHSLGLLGVGVAARLVHSPLLGWAAGLILAGVLLFSGSIYLLTFGAPRWLGIVTPLGGTALIAGWALFAAATWRAARV